MGQTGAQHPATNDIATAAAANRVQQQARALGDPTRHAIFRHIATAGRPLGVAELNRTFAFNHNAIRQHLAKLLDAGLITESKAPRSTPGRPQLVYAINPAVEGQWGTKGPYERLARLLVEIIRSGETPQQVGRRVADEFRVASPSGDVLADIAAAMARQGFAPEVVRTSRGGEVVLNECPFSATVLTDRDTVCSLHLGIAEGLAEHTDGAVHELVAYDPVEAGCRIRVVIDGAPAGQRSSGRLALRKNRTPRMSGQDRPATADPTRPRRRRAS